MTIHWNGGDLAARIRTAFPDAVSEADDRQVWLRPERLLEVCLLLKGTPDLRFDLLTAVTGVDYLDYFEVVYHLTSTVHNHGAVLKVRTWDRESPVVPSVAGVWRGANVQEREVYDLMGIQFAGHPNLARILTWEGFTGYPLRKDYVEVPRG